MKQKSGTGTGYPVPVFSLPSMGIKVKYVSKLTDALLVCTARRPQAYGKMYGITSSGI